MSPATSGGTQQAESKNNNEYIPMPKPVSYPDSPILVADLLQGNMVVTESRLLRIMHLAYERCGIVEIYRFDEMLPGESLVAHVQRHVEAGTGRGPFQEDTLIFISKLWLSRAQLPDLAAAKVECAKWWSGGGSFWGGFWREKLDKSTQTPIHQSQEWQAFLKNVLAGKQHPFIFPGLFWGTPGGEKTRPHSIVNLPLIFEGPKGQRTWGMVRQTWPMAEVSCQERAVRHLQIIKNSPVAITVVAAESGEVLYQNTSSMSLYGNHGSMDREICLPNRLDKKGAEELLQSLPENWPIEFPGCISEEQYHKTVLNSGSTASDQELQTRRSFQSARFQDDEVGLSFLQLLFLGNKLELQRLKSTIVTGLFYARIQIKSRKLRSWMLLDPDAESYHDLHIASTVEPVTFKKTYIISQTDVTDTVMAQKELSEERERMRAVLQRQYELIEVMQSSDRSKPSADGPSSRTPFQEKIQILREILSKGVANSADEADGEIHTTKVIGQGAFGTVFLGTWRGTTVAVKRMILPAAMTNSERAHQMAVMEIGISSSMSHPHLVQTYTYSIKALHDEFLGAPSSDHTAGHELRLVLEYCDKGSLGCLLKDYGGFRDERGHLDYAAVLETAADIAKGMIHLHKNNICHNDLKAGNVMFKSEGNDGRGVRAKVVDFGLSMRLDPSVTHNSNAFRGTITHMAPEVMMEGKQSKSADVYAYGITLWELLTGGLPYKGLPHVALSHLIVFQHKRPAWPESTPLGYRNLAEKCWQPDPNKRPSFDVILEELAKLRDKCMDECKPIDSILSRSPVVSKKDETLTLSVAEYASINTGSDEWMPVIMGDPPAPPPAATPTLTPTPTPAAASPPAVEQVSPVSSKPTSDSMSQRGLSSNTVGILPRTFSPAFPLLNLEDLRAAAAVNSGGRMYSQLGNGERTPQNNLLVEIASIQAEASNLIRKTSSYRE